MSQPPFDPGRDLDARLRAHLSGTADGLDEPPDRLEEVRSRARRRQVVRGGLLTVVVVLALVAVPLLAGLLDRQTVVIEPGPSPASPTPGETPEPSPEPSPDASPDAEPTTEPTSEPSGDASPPPTGDLLDPAALGSALLAYGPSTDGRLEVVERDGDRTLWPDPVDVALPDGRGGVLLQPAGAPEILWLPGGAGDDPVTLVEVDGDILLRGTTSDGEVLYSVRGGEGLPMESDLEDFFAVELAAGVTPQLLGSAPALETWTAGPVVAAAGHLVHASCHLHCTIWPGPPGDLEEIDPLYHGGGADAGPSAAIEGLTATPDGRVIGFVEFDPVMPDAREPELVLLDGLSFEVLARVPLPLPAGTSPGTPTLSLSADGQNALVTVGGEDGGEVTGAPPVEVPEVPYHVQGALGPDPAVTRVAFEGVLRWADPRDAVGPGSTVTEDERAAAEALLAFAKGTGTFEEVPLAPEVSLGLGEDLLGTPRPAGDLADTGQWSLDHPDGHFRAYAGPFSALEVLSGAGDVAVTSGAHRRCVAPPTPTPSELAGLRQVSIQPSDIDSCLSWFSVDLFLTDAGEIAAVTLDLYEP